MLGRVARAPNGHAPYSWPLCEDRLIALDSASSSACWRAVRTPASACSATDTLNCASDQRKAAVERQVVCSVDDVVVQLRPTPAQWPRQEPNILKRVTLNRRASTSASSWAKNGFSTCRRPIGLIARLFCVAFANAQGCL
jgi:hypothetical protein